MQKAHELLIEGAARLDAHDQRIERLENESPTDEKVSAVLQAVMASVDAKIKSAIAESEARDKRDDAAQLQSIAVMIKEAVTEIKALVQHQVEPDADEVAERKAMLTLLESLARPRKRTGEVTLPTGKVKMIISEMLDS